MELQTETFCYPELCNSWKLKIPLKFINILFPTSQHLYYALKFIPDDENMTSNEVKKCIQTITHLPVDKINRTLKTTPLKKREDWNKVKINKMLFVLRLKFRSNVDCRKALLSTYPQIIQYDHDEDIFWCIGKNQKGNNVMGKLMQLVRDELLSTGWK